MAKERAEKCEHIHFMLNSHVTSQRNNTSETDTLTHTNYDRPNYL